MGKTTVRFRAAAPPDNKMSSHPNLYVAAVFTRPEGSVFDPGQEVYINERPFDVVLPESEIGIGFDEDEAFAIYDYATYGWCETVYPAELVDIINNIHSIASTYAQQHGLSFKIKLGANYW